MRIMAGDTGHHAANQGQVAAIAGYGGEIDRMIGAWPIGCLMAADAQGGDRFLERLGLGGFDVAGDALFVLKLGLRRPRQNKRGRNACHPSADHFRFLSPYESA